MTDDLLSRLTAVVDEDERVAKAATPGPWHVKYEAHDFANVDIPQVRHDRWDGDRLAYSTAVAPAAFTGNAEHIAACDPEDRLRHVEHARRVMARHVPIDLQVDGACCTQCVAIRHGLPVALAWPCADLLDLAAAWGVTE